MDGEQFKQKFYQTLNLFRKKPTSIVKLMEVFKVGLIRLKSKSNIEFCKLLEAYENTLYDMPSCNKISLNTRLCEYADKYLKSIDPNDEDMPFFQSGDSVLDKIPEEYINENCIIVYDDVVDDPEKFLIKILINKEDTEHFGRKLLRDELYTQLGISFNVTGKDEGNCVLIFAKNYVEPKKEKKKNDGLPDGDLSELKQAFDLFDVEEIGKISPRDTFEAMKSINYNEKNPELFKIMDELQNEGELVDFPTFAWYIVSKISDKDSEEGLRTIFNLFVDDFEDETISLNALKKICKRLKEKEAEKEVDLLINNSNTSDRLNFEEFYEFMLGKKNGKI